MSFYKKIFILSVVALAIVFNARGQAAKSYFSSLGFGALYGTSLAHNQGMGGVGISNPQSWYLNNQNPALLVNNYITVVEAGMLIDRNKVSDGQNTSKNGSGNLNYLVMAFPVKRGKWTTSIGLMPYSAVSYKVTTQKQLEGGVGTYTDSEVGTGGINQFSWSNGVKIYKNLSLGIKTSYLFSSVIVQDVNTPAGSIYYPVIYQRNYVSGLGVTLGLSYHIDSLFNGNYRLAFGAVYDKRSNLNTQNYVRVERNSVSTGITIDSTTIVNNVRGTAVLPQSFGGGISFSNINKWTVGADFTYLDYKQFRGFPGQDDKTTAGIHSAFGAEFTPNSNSVGSYLDRMTYRAGFGYDRYPYLINNNYINDYGINLGVSLPVNRLSSLDIAVKIGKRGDVATNTIVENYFKLYFGITFNDQWFIKRKFD